MKYLIEIGIIEVDASSPPIIEEVIPESVNEVPTLIGTPLNMVLEGYQKAHAEAKLSF